MTKIPEQALKIIAGETCADLEGYMNFVFGLEPTWFHLEWMEILQEPARYPRILFICPPDSAKTTLVGIIYTSWMICKNPDIHTGYVSNTYTQAAKQSVAVRDTIHGNERLKFAYPNLQLDPTKGTAEARWFVKRPNISDKDATFVASGVGGPILGSRFDLLVCDDVVDKDNAATELQRNKVYDWTTSTAFSRVVAGGRIVIIGTRWHEDDVYGRLEQHGFKVIHYKAIDDEYRNYRE